MTTEHPQPWYAAGLAFECSGCGRCCAGPEEGYIFITAAEIEQVASHRGMSTADFTARYVRSAYRRLTIIEHPQTHDCIFLAGDDGGGRKCMIYSVRPAQCRTWPFWPHNLHNPDTWNAAANRCPGVNRGPIHPLDEIERKRQQTQP